MLHPDSPCHAPGIGPNIQLDIAREDCNELLKAVTHRLKLSAQDSLKTPLESRLPPLGSTCQFQQIVLECVQALDQICLTLTQTDQ